MSERKIAWEKWDVDLIEEDAIEELMEENTQEPELVEEALEFMNRIPKLVTTPMGMFQMHDKMNILNQFDCWMGYTNFDITHDVQNVIETIKGVELLSILTRYRFFVGTGKLFEFPDVRKEIENRLCKHEVVLNEETQAAVDAIKSVVSKDKYWTIFVSPTGQIEYVSTNNDEDEHYINSLVGLEELKKTDGGLIFQDNSENI